MGDDDGEVSREVVIRVLLAVQGECDYSIKVEGASVTIVKDGVPEVAELPDNVGRKMLGRFSGKYGVKREYFYHPEMCCGNQTRH